MPLGEPRALELREIGTLERALGLYPDDASVWQQNPGLPNPAGTLFLHLTGSLQHFSGAVPGQTSYVRDRAAGFSRRNVPRSEHRQELSKARQGVQAAFDHLSGDQLEQVFPVNHADVPVSTRLTVLQFLSHLAYHLWQIHDHRRMATGDDVSANDIDPTDVLNQLGELDSGVEH